MNQILPGAQVPGMGGSVLTYHPSPVQPNSKHLLHLADKVGGEFGVLSYAGESLPTLKLGDVHAVSGKPSERFRKAVAAREWDIRPILTHADAGFFLADYRRFLNA